MPTHILYPHNAAQRVLGPFQAMLQAMVGTTPGLAQAQPRAGPYGGKGGAGGVEDSHANLHQI